MIEFQRISRRRFHALAGSALAATAASALAQPPQVPPKADRKGIDSSSSGRPERVSRIRDVWGNMVTDLNFRKHPYGASTSSEDFPRLTAETLCNWYKSINSTIAWCWIKFQSGHASFPSKVLPRMKNLSPDFFPRFCELCRAEGMYTLGYTCGGSDVDAFQKHPEWFKEFGMSYACLNAPFWDREFESVREALKLFPCDGLFYDMVHFSGKCGCEFCRAAYKKFYGEKWPGSHLSQFRFDTFKHWTERATRAARDIVPNIEVCVNHQWDKPLGVPSELLGYFDWYFCEFGGGQWGDIEWVGEILRAWGEKPILCGNTLKPRHVAHLLGRRMCPVAYDTLTDYRTGECVPADDRRVQRIAAALSEIRKREAYLKGATAIPHATVLLSGDPHSPGSYDDSGQPGVVARWVRDVTHTNLSCCNVEIAERLTKDALEKYEVAFAPALTRLDKNLESLLRDWIKRGGVLFAAVAFPLLDSSDLLGIRKISNPLDVFAVVTKVRSGERVEELDALMALDGPVLCKPVTAQPAAYGTVGADENVPLMWRNRIGNGYVFYLAGKVGKRIDDDSGEESEKGLRKLLRAALFPQLRKTPFTTSMEYPVEVWLNEQKHENRLVMHVVAYDRPLVEQEVSIRANLIAEDALGIVYPAARKSIIQGVRSDGYVRFVLPEVYEHVIATVKSHA